MAREVVIKARLVGNTLIIEAPNYRAELEIGLARIETPRYRAELDVDDVMVVNDFVIRYMDPEDWEELITTIAGGGDVDGALGRLINKRGEGE